jgi:hypothetical protein
MINLNQTINSNSNSDIINSITSQLLSLQMPSIEASMITHPKHLCIRLATGPQYYS